MGHGTVQIVDAGNAGHAHLRSMVPSMGLGVICPEQRADSLRADKNPGVESKEKKRSSQAELWGHLWLVGGRYRRTYQIRNQRNGQGLVSFEIILETKMEDC